MIHASYILGDKGVHLTVVVCGIVGPLHQLVQLVICALSFFFFFEHALICIRPPPPFVRLFPSVLPQLEKTKNKKKSNHGLNLATASTTTNT